MTRPGPRALPTNSAGAVLAAVVGAAASVRCDRDCICLSCSGHPVYQPRREEAEHGRDT